MASHETSRVVIKLLAICGHKIPASLIAREKSYVLLEVKRPFPTSLIPRQRPQWHNRYYFPPLVTLWQKDSKLSVQFWPWHHLKRWLFTRCEGCGKRFPYGSGACVERCSSAHSQRTKSVFWGETGIYHFDCTNEYAENTCTEMWDRQWGHDDSLRRYVLHEPVVVSLELSMLASTRRDAEQAYRRRLWETRKEMGYDRWQWKLPKVEDEETRDAA